MIEKGYVACKKFVNGKSVRGKVNAKKCGGKGEWKKVWGEK